MVDKPLVPAWLPWAVPALAFVVGVSVDHLGASQRVNILAPPLLALLGWNLVVYAALAWKTMRAPRRNGWLAGLFTRGLRAPDDADLARIASVFHAAAAALALGALASLYLRGLAFEYRAGWDSTFLSAAAVHRLLTLVLGPAAWLSGLALPGADELARLRFADGPGENAARWIHLHALTLAAAVVVPRLLLAAWDARRARALSQPAPRTAAEAATGMPVAVWPYSHHASPEALQGLAAVLVHALGPSTSLHFADVLPLGGEDHLAALPWPAPTSGGTRPALALFSATATPERENHGAFIAALAARCGTTPWVLVDDSAFVRRFTGPDGASRLQQRHAAWRALAQAQGCTALFVDLLAPDLAAVSRDAPVAFVGAPR